MMSKTCEICHGVAGGQGRSAESVESDGAVVGLVLSWGLFLTLGFVLGRLL